MPDLPPLPPRKAARTADTVAADPGKSRRVERARPDPRPMRVVYGAGAIAAVSVMTVGLVQPAWDASADSVAPNAPQNQTGAQNAVGASGQRGAVTAAQPAPDVVRHVIRYVQLKPGQHAPLGATVITPDAPKPRVVVVQNPNTSTHYRPPQAAPQQPPPAAPPPPRTTTRQSGRPR